MAEVEAALTRIQAQVGSADFALFKRLVATLVLVMGMVRAQRARISRLRRFFGFSSSEKTGTVLGPDDNPAPVPPQQTGTEPGPTIEPAPDCGSKPDPKGPKAKGHGRLAASDYPAATHFLVEHQNLKAGCGCPGCPGGKLYDLKEPAQFLRIVGQPVLAALCWDCQRLRCNACGHVYTAQAPTEAQGPKFDESATSMLALCRYSAGLPHNRLADLQKNLQTPIPSSTQWDVLNDSAPTFQPVLDEMTRRAAQGEVVHDDDSYMRILALMGKRRAELLLSGNLPSPERTGLFTTAILSITAGEPIALFRTGRKYAGENLADLFKAREVHLEPPILMSDGLQSRNVPKGHAVIEANCTAHARRGIVDQAPNFPSECTYVLHMLGKVYATEAQCKQKGLSSQERLQAHQRDSGPVMQELHQWMNDQFTQKKVEPNSGLGAAYRYMLKRWDKLTLFLSRAEAPLDNNICERALKKAIRHRRNSLFYRSQRGADVGDMFMSLIHTAQLRGENAFEFLTQVQRHAKAAADSPADWLPWTYRATLARMAQQQTHSRAPPGPPSLPLSKQAPPPSAPAL